MDDRITIGKSYRADVEFGPYKGKAGVSEFPEETHVAFFYENERSFKPGSTGKIEGKPYRVLSAVQSDPAKGGVKGMVRLVVTAVTQ